MGSRLLPLLAALALAAGCSRPPAPTPATAAPPAQAPPAADPAAPAPPALKAAILEPRTSGWPRRVRDAEGHVVEIRARPERIHTLSLGFDEITMRLVGPGRFAAIAAAALNPQYSNIAAQARQVARTVGRKTEDVLAARPDLVLASPFANKDLVRQLREAGLTVVVSDLQDSLEGHAANIRFLAYLYGEEERGEALIREISARLARLDQVVAGKTGAQRPAVIRLTDKLNTAGRDTTVDGIIRRAGGINAAARAGIVRWQPISLETVVELRPDVILLAGAAPGQPDFGQELLAHPALQSVPAIRHRRVYSLPDRYMSTLSHWNVRGAEELARLLWPEDFRHDQFPEFE